MSAGFVAFLTSPVGQALFVEAINYASKRLNENPDEDPELLAMIRGYNKAVEEDRPLTDAQIDAIIARRKKLFGE